MKKIITLTILLLLALNSVLAASVKDIRSLSGEGRFIDVSLTEINHIKFPYSIKEVKTSKNLSLSIEGSSVFVAISKYNQPVELFVILDALEENKIVNLILIPKKIPSTTIEIFDPNKKSQQILEAEKSLPYEVALRNMILAAKKDGGISGYFSKDSKNVYRKTEQLLLQQIKELSGYRFKLEIWSVLNTSGHELFLKEEDFYVLGMRAISLDEHILEPDTSTLLYIIKRNSGD